MADNAANTSETIGQAGTHGRSSRIVVICVFAALGTLATNIFLPSLPKMAADLSVSSAAATSAITVYLVVSALVQLIVGPVSDRFGRAAPVLAGLCIALFGTIWCASANDLPNCSLV